MHAKSLSATGHFFVLAIFEFHRQAAGRQQAGRFSKPESESMTLSLLPHMTHFHLSKPRIQQVTGALQHAGRRSKGSGVC